jgi:hypothetical protein
MKRVYEIVGMLTISVATMLALVLLQLITSNNLCGHLLRLKTVHPEEVGR